MPIPAHKHGCIYTPHTQYTHVQQIHPCILTDKYSDSLLYTKWSISRVEDILSWCKNKMRHRWTVCLVHLQLLFYMWMIPNGEEDERWVQILESPSLQMWWTSTVLVPICHQSLNDWQQKRQSSRTSSWELCLSCWILNFHITGSGFSSYFNFYMHTWVALCQCLRMHAWCPRKPEESISFPGTGLQGPSCGCWSSNTGLLEEQPVLLTGELSL